MANPTTNFGWQMPTSTDLVTDLPADFEVFGQAVDTALVDLKGGTTGQVLSKTSGTDMDFTWVDTDDTNAIQNAIVDAKGDLIAASANDTPARLAVGTNEYRLVADSGETTGLKYVADTTNYAVAAKGNLLAGTAADTVAALAVGTNGQVLTADSAETTGLKWATPASGGGITLLSTTAITATNAINITSISGSYTNLIVYVENFKMNTNQTNIFFRFNNDTSAIYSSTATQPVTSSILYQDAATSMFVGGSANLANTGNNTLVIQIPFYSTTASYKTIDFNLMSDYGNNTTKINAGGFVGYGSTSAISEVNVFAGSGTNFSAQGNIKIYGVN